MYSEVVKQSCVSMPLIFSTPEMPARWKASRIAWRVCGRTYGIVAALGDLLVEFQRRGVMAPTEDARHIVEFEIVPLCILGRRISPKPETITAVPSVTCEQSRTFIRPAMIWLNLLACCGSLSVQGQLRVCASGLRRALEKLTAEMCARYSSLSPIALVVFIAQAPEQLRERELDSLGIRARTIPRCRGNRRR